MLSLTPSQFDTMMRKNPFFTVEKVIVTGDAVSRKNEMARDSNMVNREFGGVGCFSFHDPSKKLITVHDIVQKRDFDLDARSYRWDARSFDITRQYQCSNDELVVFHTHPSGSPEPSLQDRLTSVQTESMGCVVSGNATRCFVGTKDIPVIARY